MFPQLPTTIDQMRGGSDAAPLVDAAVGWARVEAASAAQRFAALAEWAAVFLAGEDDDSLCAVDAEDDVVAQIGLAFGISTRRAFHDLQVGAAMRERFPRLAALFLRGKISAQVMATVVDRTFLVVDDEALANIDRACAEAATTCGWSNLSYYTLKNAIDVWIERFDPDAVRRVRNTARGRGVTVGRTDDEAGITTLIMRLTKPGAALLMAKLRAMAKGVCPNDPRTLEQRLGDAAEALGADANRLKCLCGSDTCAAAADDGVASKFVIHIYGDADLADAQPDPLIHGDGISTRPDNVTIKYPTKGKKTEPAGEAEPAAEAHSTPNAEPAQSDTDPEPQSSSPQHCAAPASGGGESASADAPSGADEPDAADNDETAEPSPTEAEMDSPAGKSEAAEEAPESAPATGQESGSSAPRHCPAPTAREAEPPTGTEPEPEGTETATAETDSDAAVTETGDPESDAAAVAAPAATETTSPATSSTAGRAPGFIPGYGVVPNALIAALIAAGAEVRHIKAPNVEPTESYRLRDSDREFVQARDLTCRMPNCSRPIHDADLDHTITWGDGGPTHPSNEKGYCRRDHLLKTFRDGWSEVQHPDGTLEITTPTGHTYTSIPLSRILFPRVNTTSAPVQRGSPRKQAAADKSVKMPKRKRTKAEDRAYRIQAERALNAAYRAAGGTPTIEPAPKDDFGYRLFFGEYTQKADPNDPPPY